MILNKNSINLKFLVFVVLLIVDRATSENTNNDPTKLSEQKNAVVFVQDLNDNEKSQATKLDEPIEGILFCLYNVKRNLITL